MSNEPHNPLEYASPGVRSGRRSRALHVLALLTAAATFPLIFMGGLVTSHGAGMSVPDWPNSYGYNMFTFPPSMWVGGIFYEHTHRLMGTVVGMLSIALVFTAWRVEARRWVRWLAVSVLLAVIFQGVLGGLRVVLVKLDLAIVHACFAQAFFCLTALMVVVTSKWWFAAPQLPSASGRALIIACVVAVVAIYLQLIVGAMMRHYRAGLAVPDFPFAYGQVIPATDSGSMVNYNNHRTWDLHLEAVSTWQIWFHMAHRIGAVIVGVVVLATAAIVVVRHRGERKLLLPAILLLALLTAQVTLGALTVLWRKPADVASLHVAVGAMTLVTTFVLAVRSIRLYSKSPATADAVRGVAHSFNDERLAIA